MSMTSRELRRQEEQEATMALRRRAAVTAATDLFAEQGFHATAMADIARTSGLSLKTLYASFPSKEALFEAVMAEVGERFSSLLDTFDPSCERTRWLVGFVNRVVELLADNTAALRLYSRGADGIPIALREKGVDPFAGFMRRLVDLLADTVREVQTSGGARGVDAAVLARGILNITIAEARHRLEMGEPVAGAAEDLHPVVASMLRAPEAGPPGSTPTA